VSDIARTPHADVERVLPYLKAMGTAVFRFGQVGTGHTAKIINNMISLSTLALVSEATYLARYSGLDVETFYRAVMAGNGKSGTIETFGPRLLARDHIQVNFRIELATKDLGLSQQLVTEANQPFFVSSATYKMYQVAEMLGLSKADISNIAELRTLRRE
jgi:3-hydroxyisobutyrate dehydrogenase-like beta-hydroxyacid dehydrogenase